MDQGKVQVQIDAAVRDRYKVRAATNRTTIGDEIRAALECVEREESKPAKGKEKRQSAEATR